MNAIDISLCTKIDEAAVIRFIKNRPGLVKFNANHLEKAMTDACMEVLGNCKGLHVLNINFCKQITSAGIEFIVDK